MQRRPVLGNESVDLERQELGVAGDDMADCLERFLAATADEPTMQRARRAVVNWHGVRARQASGQPVKPVRALPALEKKPKAKR